MRRVGWLAGVVVMNLFGIIANASERSTYQVTCEGFVDPGEVTFTKGSPDTAEVRIGDLQHTLPRARSGSGAHYKSQSVSFWVKGNDATYTVSGQFKSRCNIQAG